MSEPTRQQFIKYAAISLQTDLIPIPTLSRAIILPA